MIATVFLFLFAAALVVGGLTVLHLLLRPTPFPDLATQWTLFLSAWIGIVSPIGAAVALYLGV